MSAFTRPPAYLKFVLINRRITENQSLYVDLTSREREFLISDFHTAIFSKQILQSIDIQLYRQELFV
jgi:hypothetical protein